ncbi:phage tail protein, partial [Salmonella enterica subsp. enterica serovar Enteritidis]|nr:phage tail protein [Salmonella enterica subsp. enterica serovar Enteritidis]
MGVSRSELRHHLFHVEEKRMTDTTIPNPLAPVKGA